MPNETELDHPIASAEALDTSATYSGVRPETFAYSSRIAGLTHTSISPARASPLRRCASAGFDERNCLGLGDRCAPVLAR